MKLELIEAPGFSEVPSRTSIEYLRSVAASARASAKYGTSDFHHWTVIVRHYDALIEKHGHRALIGDVVGETDE